MRGASFRFSSTVCSTVAVTLTTIMFIGSPVWAADEDMSAVRQDIKALKEAVERLDQHVQNLERRLAVQPEPHTQSQVREAASEPPPAEKVRTPSPQTILREHWQTIERGMQLREVEGLLGRPDRTVPLPGKTVWYYSYPDIGSGSVVFAEDGEVTDWQSPPFTTWAW